MQKVFLTKINGSVDLRFGCRAAALLLSYPFLSLSATSSIRPGSFLPPTLLLWYVVNLSVIFSSLPSKRSPYFHTARLPGFLFPLWQQTRLEKTCFPTSMTWWTIWRFTWSATVIPRLTLSRFVPNWEMGLRYSFILYLFDANCFMFVRLYVSLWKY